MRNIVMPLPEPAHAALIRQAVTEFRTPKEQAQKAIVEHLRTSGALPREPSAPEVTNAVSA
jgi:hypothetical protein